MSYCPNCRVSVKGDWEKCPLCDTELEQKEGKRLASPYPNTPLRFDKQKATKLLLLVSFLIILATYLLGLLWKGQVQGLQGALFGIMTMWLVVLIIIRKRRNLIKSIFYLLISLSFICTYFDYVIGWTGWSTTYAIPIICGSSILAMFLTIRFVKIKTGDYILYLMAAALVGLVPILFLFLDWVTNPWPAWVSFGLSLLMLVLIFIFQGKEIRKEFQKRMFI